MPVAAAIARALRVSRPIDIAIAGGLALWALVEAFVAEGPGTVTSRVGLALGYTAPLLWRRRFALAALAVVAGLLVVRSLTADVAETGTFPFPSLLVATFSVACHVGPTALAAPAVLLPLGAMFSTIPTEYWTDGPTPGDMAILSFFVVAAWTAGRVVRHRSQQVDAVRLEGGERARLAVADERARIARELHDVVAHSVSIIAVQAGAAEALVERDPGVAREHLGAVRRTAQEALAEMRRLLDVLREDGVAYAPQPTLAGLAGLVEETRGAGVPVELEHEGRSAELPAGVDLAAYRIVQEALTNVRRHAGGASTRVRVRQTPAAVEVEVVNGPGTEPGEGPGGGHGLVGMRERARLYGGSLDAGPDGDDGWAVRARLPVEGPA